MIGPGEEIYSVAKVPVKTCVQPNNIYIYVIYDISSFKENEPTCLERTSAWMSALMEGKLLSS